MGRRYCARAMRSLAVVLCVFLPLPNVALGLTEDEDASIPDPEEVYQELPPALQAKFESLYPEFSNVFTLFVDWNPEVDYQFWPWHPDSVESLVTKIMPPQTLEDMYNLSIAEKVLRYFGDDRAADYDSVNLEAS